MEKNLGRRPLKFKTGEDLQAQIDAYFESCWDKEVWYTSVKSKKSKKKNVKRGGNLKRCGIESQAAYLLG